MKQDLPPRPDKVPKKDRHLEGVPDLWIAEWLADASLPYPQRARLEALKARRRANQPDVPVGLLVGAEGLTARQLDAVVGQLRTIGPTEIHHPGVASRLHQACKRLSVPVIPHDDVRRPENGMLEVIRLSSVIIAAPREMSERGTSPVWNMIRRAKHRSVPVRIVLPDGRVTGSGRDSV